MIAHLKKQNHIAVTYLLLKDIFPQNAVDLGMMTKSGVKGLQYKFFRKKEKKLYALSDCIGCISPANVEYVLKYNPEIKPEWVEVAPNSLELSNTNRTDNTERDVIRKKYGIPYGQIGVYLRGNLGKPQGIPFLIEC